MEIINNKIKELEKEANNEKKQLEQIEKRIEKEEENQIKILGNKSNILIHI